MHQLNEKKLKKILKQNSNIFFSLNVEWNSNSSFHKKLRVSKTKFEAILAILQTKALLFPANKWASIISPYAEFYWWGIPIAGGGLSRINIIMSSNFPSLRGGQGFHFWTLSDLHIKIPRCISLYLSLWAWN